ncbi:MAG: inositol monophosphatase family protein [Solirubrobacteraceae bacterium]
MNPDLGLALELADIAAAIALPRFGDRDFTVTIKPDGSPVTDVDRAVERALRERLARRRHDHAVLGEEYGAAGDSEWCWYLDPIDGTSRFVEGDAGWMTLVALGHGQEVTVGVISTPARSHRWWASRGEGAFGDG